MTGKILLLLKEEKLNPFLILRDEYTKPIYNITTLGSSGLLRVSEDIPETRLKNRFIYNVDSFLDFTNIIEILGSSGVANSIIVFESYTTISTWIRNAFTDPYLAISFQSIGNWKLRMFEDNLSKMVRRDNLVIFVAHAKYPINPATGELIPDAKPEPRGISGILYFSDAELYLYRDSTTNAVKLKQLLPFEQDFPENLLSKTPIVYPGE